MTPTPQPVSHRRLLRQLLVGACLVLFAASAIAANSASERTLSEGWEFRLVPDNAQAQAHAEATTWHAASVPGTVHTDLLANRLIPDPYVGAPEAGLQWIGLADWEYRTTFAVPRDALGDARSDLVFEGLDTIAEVYLNGEKVLDANNFFRTWRVPVQGKLREAGNELRVVLRSPIAKLLPQVQAMPQKIAGNYPSPYGDEPKDAMTANFVRKPGYHYGWDWGPRYVTAGVWKPVKLQSWDTLRVADLQLRQDKVTEAQADVAARVSIDAAKAGNYRMRVHQVDPDGTRKVAAEQGVTLAAGDNTVVAPLRIAKPQRWFPVGYGAQPLYRFEVEVLDGNDVVAQVAERTGLRSVELRTDKDAKGRDFHFVINGIPVFAKGANYIPFDMFEPRVTEAQQRRVLQSAVDANMNIIRGWGGGYYESDRFYDMADEMGLLVWQDFMFGGGMQPGYDDAFRANVVAEARDQVRRLRDHPSIVLWCGNNEEEIAWKYWGGGNHGKDLKAANPAFAGKVWNGYVQLFGKDLREVVEEEGGGIAYWSSSPSDDLAEVANTPAAGDMHYWEVWGNPARPPVAYLDVTPRFMSEYGLQAWPVQRTIDFFAKREEQGIATPVIEAHQKFLAGKGNQRLLHYVEMEFGEPKDFADFVYLSQATQAEGIELAALHHRASRPYTMGTLYWQLNDVWPGASWSGMDWFGRWKALQFHARRFFAPLAVAALRKDGRTALTLVSDLTTPVDAEWTLRVIDFDGRQHHAERHAVTLPLLSATSISAWADGDLLHGADPKRTVAVFELRVDGASVSRRVIYFDNAKALALPRDPGLRTQWRRDGNQAVLRLQARHLTRALWIDFEGLDAGVSDNALTLLPGEPVDVRVQTTADEATLARALRLRWVGGQLSESRIESSARAADAMNTKR